jgi:cysteine synthase A
MNPTSSVKDRLGLALIEDGIKRGLINSDTQIVEPTSGNTGIGLASICASMNLNLTLTMPESMSLERRELLKALGANLVLTDASKGMSGAIEKAKEIVESNSNSYMPLQFENIANKQMHERSTALEILKDLDGKIDIFVASVGTGGTLMGVARVLKAYNKDIKIVAVEPKDSSVLSGGTAGPHKIQGIGAGFIPKIVDITLVDEVVTVSNEEAISSTKDIAKREGLLVGISSGANIYATNKISKKYRDKTIVTILCDTGERYISSGLYRD